MTLENTLIAAENLRRERLIKELVLAEPGAEVRTTIVLWTRLAAELIQIIGESGFDALFARSLHQAGALHTLLSSKHPAPANPVRFADLQARLESGTAEQAGVASILLLSTFLHTLHLLIGALLTTSILRSAWGDGAFDHAGTES